LHRCTRRYCSQREQFYQNLLRPPLFDARQIKSPALTVT